MFETVRAWIAVALGIGTGLAAGWLLVSLGYAIWPGGDSDFIGRMLGTAFFLSFPGFFLWIAIFSMFDERKDRDGRG
jgi:hypothetical protein